MTTRFKVIQDNSRVDLWLSRKIEDSRSNIKKSIKKGLLLVNGKKVKASSSLKKGDIVEYTPVPPPLSKAVPQKIPLEIVYEDEDVLVVDKTAGMVVHPAPGHPDGTLVNALLGRGTFSCPEGELRPGIVHRIDKDTSGLLVVAKSQKAKEKLVEDFRRHEITRQYTAVLRGYFPIVKGTFSTLYGRNPRHRIKFSSKVKKGKRAITHYSVQKTWGQDATLVKVQLDTGRTHQVRVHFYDAGYPLLGDPLYRKKGGTDLTRKLHEQLGRQALHASLLGFTHPLSGKKMEYSSQVPTDMQAILDILEKS
ncbi:MAG: RluA family pseudouridine synthase [Deltaproteobacteria bacterium]|nr:RluA family pseudouridine synthase [Deltaproteobacteria bacterium]